MLCLTCGSLPDSAGFPGGSRLWHRLQRSTLVQTWRRQLWHPHAQLLRDVRAFHAAVLREEGRPDTVVLACKLAAVGYAVRIRTALGGGAGQACFHNLRCARQCCSSCCRYLSCRERKFGRSCA